MEPLTSLTLILAGVKASVAVDELADGVETTAAVTGVHYGVLQDDHVLVVTSIMYISAVKRTPRSKSRFSSLSTTEVSNPGP